MTWGAPSISPSQLGRLTTLTELYIGENQLTSMPGEWSEGGKLEVSGCQITR